MLNVFVIIGLILILFIFGAFKMNNFRTKTAYIFILLGVFFVFLTGYIIFSGKEVNLTTIGGISDAAKTYLSFFGTVASNLVKVTSYAFNQEWKDNPDNDKNG